MKRMEFDPDDYTETGDFGRKGGIIGFFVALILYIIIHYASYYYFTNTNIQIIASESVLLLIVLVATLIEVGVIYYFRNRNRDLAKFPKSEFDSSKGCWILIGLLVFSFRLNYILLYEINGRFDPYASTKRTVKITGKYSRADNQKMRAFYRHHFLLDSWKDQGKHIDLEVPLSVFNQFSSNTLVEFDTKPGLLGLEHLSSEIKASK